MMIYGKFAELGGIIVLLSLPQDEYGISHCVGTEDADDNAVLFHALMKIEGADLRQLTGSSINGLYAATFENIDLRPDVLVSECNRIFKSLLVEIKR